MNEFLVTKYIEPMLDSIAVRVLKDWATMEMKIDIEPEKIFEARERMTSIHGFSSDTPVQGGGDNRREEMLVDAIDKIMLAEHGAKEAEMYFTTVMPAWNKLTDDERYLLWERFVTGEKGIQRIMARKNVEKTLAYDMSNKALAKFRRLLFW